MKMSLEKCYVALFSSLIILLISILAWCINAYHPGDLAEIMFVCTSLAQSVLTEQSVLATFFTSLLLLVILTLVAKLFFSWRKTHHRMGQLRRLTSNDTKLQKRLLTLLANLSIPQSEVALVNMQQHVALTIGIWQPKIIVSEGLLATLTDQELSAVLLHERYHQLHKHGFLYIFSEAVGASLLLIPIVKLIIRKMKLQLESAADTFATDELADIAPLVAALNKLQSSTREIYYPGFASLVESRLSRFTTNSKSKTLIDKSELLLSIFVILVLSLFAIMPVFTQPVFATASMDSCVKEQRCLVDCHTSKVEPAPLFSKLEISSHY